VVWHSATRWGSRDAVLVATRVLAVVYGLLVPLQLVVLHGTARVVTVSLAAVSCLVFAAEPASPCWWATGPWTGSCSWSVRCRS
jgi:hypothetical protein